MIYLSILLLLFFTFCNSNELIRDLQSLQEKAQDNISKRTAVEKEPLSLEKVKKDQSKCYLSISKLHILDMKWANSDINVVGWTCIRKFSTLDNIVTPQRLLELFVNKVLIGSREKAGISFEIDNEKLRLFLSMLLLSGCHELPDCEIYWEATPDAFS